MPDPSYGPSIVVQSRDSEIGHPDESEIDSMTPIESAEAHHQPRQAGQRIKLLRSVVVLDSRLIRTFKAKLVRNIDNFGDTGEMRCEALDVASIESHTGLDEVQEMLLHFAALNVFLFVFLLSESGKMFSETVVYLSVCTP